MDGKLPAKTVKIYVSQKLPYIRYLLSVPHLSRHNCAYKSHSRRMMGVLVYL